MKLKSYNKSRTQLVEYKNYDSIFSDVDDDDIEYTT